MFDVFDKIRIHRATTDRPRDGKNCGCNECFGLCNAPHGITTIGTSEINDSTLAIVFLYKRPTNFETEFGVDEPYTLYNGKQTYKVKTGVYKAKDVFGKVNLRSGIEVPFYGLVIVNLSK